MRAPAGMSLAMYKGAGWRAADCGRPCWRIRKVSILAPFVHGATGTGAAPGAAQTPPFHDCAIFCAD